MKEYEIKYKVARIVENAVFRAYSREQLDEELRAYLGKPVSESVDVEEWNKIATFDEICDSTRFVVSVFKACSGQFTIYSYEIID